MARRTPKSKNPDNLLPDIAKQARRLRVAIYIRISTDEEHQPFSLEAQRTKLASYIDIQPDWENTGLIFSDEASGATTERKNLQRALTAAKAGRFDILLVYRVDRLSRSLRGLVSILDDLETVGVSFRSATEPFDTATPVGRMLVQMLGVFAQFERETIIDRVINGMERKAAKGQWCGGYRPTGYDLDKTTGMLTPLPVEVPVVETIFHRYVDELIGAKAIANGLNEQGLRTKYGKPWSAQSVLVVLANRVYIGEVYFRGTWYKAERHHPAIIDATVFEQAQQIMIARGEDRANRAYSNTDYLYAGHIVCAHCQKRYVGAAAHGNRYRYRYYICFTSHRYGTDACQGPRLRADQLEPALLDAMVATYQRSGLIEEALNDAADRGELDHERLENEMHAVVAELDSVEAKIDRYLTSFENGKLSEEQCGRRVDELSRQAAQLRGRRDELQEALTMAPEIPTPTNLDLLRKYIAETIQLGDPTQVRHMINALVAKIVVSNRDQIQPYFYLPSEAPGQEVGEKVRPLYGSVPPVGVEPTLSEV
jgi:site-specific DNA recombinase